MKLSENILSIVVNPFSAPLDSKGRACALVACDPESPSAMPYIGAKTRAIKVARPGNPMGDGAKVEVEYTGRVAKVADTDYYRRKLASGEVVREADAGKLVGEAQRAFRESGLSIDVVRAAWGAQGLGVFADALVVKGAKAADPPEPDKAPVADTLDNAEKENPS